MAQPYPRRPALISLAALAAGGVTTLAPAARADDPILRHQEDVHGDVRVFGATLAHDCGAPVPPPAGANASCAGQQNVDDTSPDLYWRDKVANASIAPTDARTSATLALPLGAKVTHARLYWAALRQGSTPDKTAVLDWLGGPTQTITADQTWTAKYPFDAHPDWYYYQASGDATAFVAKWGAGDFRVTDIEALPLANVEVDRAFSAWTLVVFYEHPDEPLRNLALFDGFISIDPDIQGEATANLSGFLVPDGFEAHMTAITYEGDSIYDGDHFTFNGVQVTDASNPLENFFNSSRSFLGSPVSGNFDVPKLSGEPGSMAGYDLDTIDIKPHIDAGDTSAKVGADSTYDIFFLGGFVTSVTTLSPDFEVTKTMKDLNGGAVLKDDVLELTVTGTNKGNDVSSSTVITDVLEPGLVFVPGSIEIIEGANKGKLTDKKGDDPGEYDAAKKTVTVRVGTGANAKSGGGVEPGESVAIKLKAKVGIEHGTLANQAVLKAAGSAGGPEKSYLSDADPAKVGDQPTEIQVDECATDEDCPEQKPVCNEKTNTCEGCESDDDCPDPDEPACQPDGTCGECSATNDSKCDVAEPVCNTDEGLCVLCTVGPGGDASACADSPQGPLCIASPDGSVHCGCLEDSDCGLPDSGKVCEPMEGICVPGCLGEGGNGCPEDQECTSTDTTIGDCVPTDGGEGGGGGGGGKDEGGDGYGADSGNAGDDGSCACAAPGARLPAGALAPLAAGLAALGLVLRRRRSGHR